jgi:hypothetical protein
MRGGVKSLEQDPTSAVAVVEIPSPTFCLEDRGLRAEQEESIDSEFA